MANKKVLYIHHGGAGGGAPRSLAFLIGQLDKAEFDAVIACNNDYDKLSIIFNALGAKTVKVPYLGGWYGSTVSPVTKEILSYNLKHIIPSYFGIKKVIEKEKPDLIHLNSTCLCFVAKSIRKSFPTIPIICHVREPLIDGFWGNILRINCEKYVDRYIAIEKYDADSLLTKKKVDIIYNFVDFDIYNKNVKANVLREELGLDSQQKIILYLARVCPENGALEFAIALEDLLLRRSDIHFCIVGVNQEEQTDYMKKILKISKKHPNIHIFEFRSDVPQVIASADIMAVPFQVPHFARSIIEAAAMGIPSIASNIGGVNELVVNDETGYLLDPKTFAGVERICESLIDNKLEYSRISENAEQFARCNFDAVINAQKTLDIYRNLLD